LESRRYPLLDCAAGAVGVMDAARTGSAWWFGTVSSLA
jgi:hypothetical protein